MKYETQGDRCLSAERYEWEDVPSALVDSDAAKENAAEFSNETGARGAQERGRKFPGLHLPGTGGIFLLDQYNGLSWLRSCKRFLSFCPIPQKSEEA